MFGCRMSSPRGYYKRFQGCINSVNAILQVLLDLSTRVSRNAMSFCPNAVHISTNPFAGSVSPIIE